MTDNSSTNRTVKKGGLLQRFTSSLRVQFSAVTILMSVLPLVILAVVLGAFVSRQVGGALRQSAFKELSAVRAIKTQQIENWFDQRLGDARFLVGIGAVRGDGADAGIPVLSQYKDEPSNPDYQAAFKHVDVVLRGFAEQVGGGTYDDIMLLDLKGDVVYATDPDVRGGNEAETPAFQSGLQAPYVGDMSYIPEQDSYNLRISYPVSDADGESVGVLVLEVDAQALSQIMQERTGLGETGETYLVGPDQLFRNDSRFLDQLGVETTILNEEVPVDTVASRNALMGEVDTQSIEDYRGKQVLSSWSPVTLQEPNAANPDGTTWGLIAEINEDEALADLQRVLRALGTAYVIGLGAVIVIAAVVGSVVAGRLVEPIVNLTDSASSIASGDLDVTIPSTPATNEVGVLTNAFALMTERLRETIGSLRETADELTERTRELEASQSVTFAASERVSPDELLGLVVDLIRDQFELYHAQVYLVNEEEQAAVLRQSTGYAGSQLLQEGHRIPMDATSLVTRAIHTAEPVLVDDTETDPNFMPNPLLPDTRSELVVPLKVGDEVIGVLDAQDMTPGRFTEGTVSLFQTMSNQVAFLFENSELLERVTDQAEALRVFTTQLRTVAEIARQVGTILDPGQLLNQVVELMQSRFGLYHAHIYELDEMTDNLVVSAGSGEVGRVLVEDRHSIPFDREKSLVARAARTQEPVLVEDTTLESDFMPNPLLPQTRSELVVPLIVGGELLGALDMQDDQAGRFTEDDLDTYAILAGQIATALQTAKLFEQTESRLRVSQVLAPAQTEDEVLDAMVDVADFYPNAGVAIHLFDPEAEEPTLVLQRQKVHESGLAFMHEGSRFSASEYSLMQFVDEDESFISSDIVHDERSDSATVDLAHQVGYRSVAVLPITAGDDWLGIVVAGSTEEGYFDEHKLHLYRNLAEQGASSLREARLRDQLSLTQFSVNRGPAAIYWLEPDASLYDVNETACQMLGYSREELLSIGSFTDLDPNFPPEAWAAHWQDLKDQEQMVIQTEHRAKDGSIIPVEVEVNYLKYGDMEFNCAFARDISERLEAEQAVRESEERLRLMLQSVQDYAIITLDPEGNISSWNEGAQRIKGYTEDEIIGEHYSIFYTEEDRKSGHVDEVMRLAREQGSYEERGLRVRKDGSAFWADVTVTAIRDEDGSLRGFSKVTRDITERRKAQQAVREARDRAQTYLDVAGTIIVALDDQGDVTLLNKAGLDVLGYEEEEVIGRNWFDLTIPEEASGDVNAVFQEIMAGEVKQAEYHENEIITKDGDRRIVAWHNSLLRDEDGNITGVLSSGEDITERKQAEEQIKTFQTLTETSADGILMADPETQQITYANRAAHTLFGCDYESREMIGADGVQFWPEEELSRLPQILERAVTEGWQGDVQQRRLDGSQFAANVTTFALQDAAGKPTDLVVMVRDITERKEAEAERERFTTRLETAAEISEQVGSILDPDELLETVIPLIKEEFGLYYVHVYTLDKESGMLNLRAGYGEAGEKMLAEGHAIPADREASLVATAARTKEPVLVDDVTEDPNFMPNPLLPDTKTEVAVPSIAGGEVLGVFDVQHDEKHYFTDADIDVFLTLAGQIANAFQSAALLEEAAEAQTRFRTVADFTYDWETWMGPDEQYIYVSPASERITGYTPDEIIENPELVVEMAHPDDRELVEAHLHEHKSTQETEPIEYRIITKDGDERWVGHACQTVYDDDGNWLGRRGSNRNITEAKQAEQELADSEERFRGLFEESADATLLIQDGRFVDCNRAALQMLRLDSKEEVIDTIPGEFSPELQPDGQLSDEKSQEMIDLAIEKGSHRFEWIHRRADGEDFPAEVLLTPMEQAGETVIHTVWRDISERKQAERERERFTSRLETAAEISEQVGSILDPDELLETVIPLIKEEFGLYYVHVYTLDKESGMLNLRAGYGEAGEKMLAEGHAIPADREASLVATAARTKEPVLVDDVTEDPNFMPNPLLPDTKTEVAVPSIAGGEVMGVFDVQHDEKHYFTDADLDVFQTLAGQIANAFRSAELFERVEASLRETEVRLRVSQALAGVETEREVWDAMLAQSGLYPQAGVGLYAIVEEDDEQVMITQAFDSFDTELAEEPVGTRFPADEFEAVEFVLSGDPFVTDNVSTDERMGAAMEEDARKLGYVSLAAVPITQGDTVIGVIVAHSPQEAYFDNLKLNLYATLAEQGAGALQAARLQETIRESQVKFQTVADYTYDWEYWLGPDDEFRYVSPACEEITGYAADEFMDDPQLLSKIVHPDDQDALHHHMHAYHENPAEVETAEESVETEFRIVTKDGDVRWIGHACQPVYGPEGEWLGRRASNRDATESIQAREALAQNEERLSLALESGRVGIWEFWPQRDDVYYNPTWYTMLGYEPYELPQDLSTWGELLHPEDAERADAVVQESIQTGEDFQMQFQMKARDGDWRWVQAHGYVTEHTPDGMAERIIGTHTDITERKQAELERERFTSRLETAAEISEQVGSILDPDELLEAVIPLIKEEFGLYYVHVYTLDEENGMLNLRAGYGEAGEKMLAEGHAIPLDREASLVTTAARTKEPVLVDDVTDDPTFMPNPLLPDTKTEVAVPSIAGGEVQGVFDVQHDEAHYFTNADIDVFQTLAGQIANAFRSARLFEQMGVSEQRFRGLYEASPLGIALNDYETGDYLEANDALLEMVGYTLEELNALSYWDLTPKKYGEQEQEMIELMEETGQYGPYEKEYIHKNGDTIPVVLNGVVVTDPTGRKLIWSTVEDITERKEAQAELERLGLAMEQTADGVAIADLEGEVQFANEAFAAMHGYSVDEIKGKNLAMFHTQEQLKEEVLSFNEQAMKKGHHEGEVGHVHRDGTTFPTYMTSTVIEGEDGKPIGLVGTARDITERKQAEAEREEQRALLNGILSSLPVGVWVADQQFNVLLTNEYQRDMMGRQIVGEGGEAIVERYDVINFETGEMYDEGKLPIVQTMSDGEPRMADDMGIRWPDGNVVPVMTTTGPLVDAEDNQVGTVAITQDITERKEAELERERFTTRLETAAEISEQVGSILDPDELLEAVIPLIKEEFGLYYVHVYTLDEDSRMLNLRAGYGEAGEKMLAEGHAIPLDREASLVAKAARTKEPVLVDDVTDDPNFMPNPLLPDTKTEVAVPAIAGGEVLGVFDVQHDEPHYFTEADLDVFQTLAGQIANAFQSAALLEEMTEAQTRFQTVADFTYDWETWMGPDERYIYVSPACERITGYKPEEIMENPELVVKMAHPDDKGVVEAHLHEHKSTIETEPIEYRIITKDGEERWLGHACQPVYDDDGNWLGRRGSNRNITETKQREVFLEKQSATLAELTASETVYSGDLDAALEEITEAAAQTLGVRRTSVWVYNPDHSKIECVDLYVQGEGHSDGTELSAEDYPKYFEALSEEHIIAADDAHSNPHTREFSESYLTPHGINSMLDAPVRLAGEMVGVVCSEHVGPPREWTWEERSFITSIADFVASAMEAQERQRFTTQLRTAADLAGDINAILDPEKLLPEVVNELQDRFDLYHVHIYTLDQPSIDVLEKVNVDDASRMLSERKLVMHAGSGEVGQQLLEQGHSIPIDADSLVARAARRSKVVAVADTRQEPDFMANPLLPDTRSEVAVPLIAGDEVLGVLDVQDSQPGRFTDSDLDVLQTLAGQIGIALQNAGLFEDVQVATQRLREADQRKSEFLADMSHELRTPLNSIIGYAELMLMGISEMDPDTLEDVQAIYDNGRHLLKIINNILDLSKIEAGRMELNIEEVHVPSLIEEIKVSSAGLLVDKEKPVEMRTDVDDDVPSIEADRVRLSQILNNLVGNAIKFTEEGSITLRAYTEDGWVYMEVEDTGPGMTEKDLQEIFERFRRIEDSFTRRAEGTGLGLSITRYLVDMHGGTIDVESEVGEGSTFTVCLPIQHPETDVDAEADV